MRFWLAISAEMWKTFGEVAKEKGWAPVLKLCLILFVAGVPIDIALLFAYILRH